jgi:hypothetical protein
LQNLPALSGRVLAGESALQDRRQRCDARVRMYAEELTASECDFGVIEKHERLDQITNTGRADQPRDPTLPVSGGAKSDAAPADVRGWRTQRSCIKGGGAQRG